MAEANSLIKFEVHPAANLFPLMTEDEYEGLKQDIAENGQREDIVVWCGKLIDGRNRLRACEELQRQPSIAELDEDQDPWKYVISHNLHRRHLTTSQRAMVASKLATLKRVDTLKKGNKKPDSSIELSGQEDVAKMLSTSVASVKRAKTVIEHGSKELIDAVENREVTVSLAEKLCKACDDKKQQAKRRTHQDIEQERQARIKEAEDREFSTTPTLDAALHLILGQINQWRRSIEGFDSELWADKEGLRLAVRGISFAMDELKASMKNKLGVAE